MQLCKPTGSLLFVSCGGHNVHRLAVNFVQFCFHLLLIFICSKHAFLNGRRELRAIFIAKSMESIWWLNHTSRSLWSIITICIISISCLRIYFLHRTNLWIWGIRGSLGVILQSFDNIFFNQWLFRVQNFRFIVRLLVPIFRQTLLLGEIPSLFRFILWILTLRLFAITMPCRILTFKTLSCWC